VCSEVDEATKFHNSVRSGPVENLFDVPRVRLAAVFVDNVRQKPYFAGEKVALIQVQNHTCFIESTKDHFDMSFVFLCCFAEDEDVVQVDDAELVDVFA